MACKEVADCLVVQCAEGGPEVGHESGYWLLERKVVSDVPATRHSMHT